jgi:hypothetical protein
VLNIHSIQNDLPPLQDHYWPPVDAFANFTPELEAFLDLSVDGQRACLAAKRQEPEAHGAFVQDALGAVYGYVYAYRDSPLYLVTDDELEEKLYRAKLMLERELFAHFLCPDPAPEGYGPEEGCAYLRAFVAENPGVMHPLFDFIRDRASPAALREFLCLEVLRNEVVDDEVAFLVIGLQGPMKKVMTSNLWDECGNGRLDRFHTYWLRRLLNSTMDWEGIQKYRSTSAPWFSRMTSNSFNRLLTRPGYKYQAYGHFLVTEGWVLPHFDRIVRGLRRVGLSDPDVEVYFTAHMRIDPQHTEEMLAGIHSQRPPLTRQEVADIILGAHTAAAAGVKMFDRVERYLARVV